MNMQSRTFKYAVLMFIGTYCITWMVLSIQHGEMYKPPPEFSLSTIIAMILQAVNGVVGKFAELKVSQGAQQ